MITFETFSFISAPFFLLELYQKQVLPEQCQVVQG
jgi:hypothetical protein